MNERAVLSGQADGAAAMLIDEADDFLVELTQHHLDDVHHLFVGHTHALPELARDTHRLQKVANLRPPAVHDHRVHANELQHDDITGKP